MGLFDVADYVERIDPAALSLFLVLGTIAAGVLVELSARNFRRVKTKYVGRKAHCGLSGRIVAERLLAICGLTDVRVTRGATRDGYHPGRRHVQLSASTYDTPSLCSLAAAAHEVGHAQQFAAGLLRVRLRQIFWPICYAFSCQALFLWLASCAEPMIPEVSSIVMWIPPLFAAIVLLQIPITLPLECDASARARRMLQEQGLITADELPAFDELLDAAWRTHAAAEGRRGILLIILVAVAVCFPTFLAQLDVTGDMTHTHDGLVIAKKLPGGGPITRDELVGMFAPMLQMGAAIVLGLLLLSKVQGWAKLPAMGRASGGADSSQRTYASPKP